VSSNCSSNTPTSRLSVRSLFLVFLLASSVSTAQTIDQVETLLRSGQADSARALLKMMDGSSESRYFAGRLASIDGTAKRLFREITRTGDAYAADAHFELAESAYADPIGLYVTARRTFLTFVEQFPQSPHIPLALYRIGRTYQITSGGRGSQIDSARTFYREVIARFPGHEIVGLAAVALVEADLQAGDPAAAERDAVRLPVFPVWKGVETVYQGLGRSPDPVVLTGKFWVQVGAFTKRSSIDGLVSRLEGTVPSIRQVESGRMTLVQVGPYSTLERAERSSSHIARVESLTCRVIQE
jgi:hypothetical protein